MRSFAFSKVLTISFFLMVLLLQACTDSNTKENQENKRAYPHLRLDTLNVFQVGDTFTINLSMNSCCSYCWLDGDLLKDNIKTSPLFEVIEVSETYDDPNCHGCADLEKILCRCIKEGTDTLKYAAIENGYIAEFGIGCEYLMLDSNSLRNQDMSIESFTRKYILKVQ